jgi:hypothetical protein
MASALDWLDYVTAKSTDARELVVSCSTHRSHPLAHQHLQPVRPRAAL